MLSTADMRELHPGSIVADIDGDLWVGGEYNTWHEVQALSYDALMPPLTAQELDSDYGPVRLMWEAPEPGQSHLWKKEL